MMPVQMWLGVASNRRREHESVREDLDYHGLPYRNKPPLIPSKGRKSLVIA